MSAKVLFITHTKGKAPHRGAVSTCQIDGNSCYRAGLIQPRPALGSADVAWYCSEHQRSVPGGRCLPMSVPNLHVSY